jgi:hypothetical protein
VPWSVTKFIETHRPLFQQLLPRTAAVLRPVNERLRAYPCMVPLRAENKRQASVIGTAAEFGVGWHFGAKPARMVERAAACGARGRSLARVLKLALTELRVRDAPHATDAQLMAPALVLLGLADASFRTGGRYPVPPPDPATARALATWQRDGGAEAPLAAGLAPSVPPALAAELAGLLRHTASVLGPPRAAQAVNPAFMPYGAIGGADADLIVDGTIVEVKVLGGERPTLEPEHLWQLLCYAALDSRSPAPYAPERVGFWELRRGFKWSETIEAVSLSAGDSPWPEVRARLLAMLRSPG